MQNIYIFRDTVSGQSSGVFSFENDMVMRRSCIASIASMRPELARDTVVLHIGTIDFDRDNCPVVCSVDPRIALSGSSPEVAAARDLLMNEAARYGQGGESYEK